MKADSRSRVILAITAVSVVAAFVVPAAPQPTSYHDFADHRSFFGLANALDVASNVGFLLVGIAGLWVALRPRTRFEQRSERWPYAVFFAGMLLTALGSGYYHLAPDNERLFWDRLPMTIAFMSLLAAQAGDRIHPRAGRILLLIAWMHPSRYTRGNDLYAVFAAYVLAKLLEALDPQILALGHVVSGHTLKHLAAAGGGLLVARMLHLRTLQPAGALA